MQQRLITWCAAATVVVGFTLVQSPAAQASAPPPGSSSVLQIAKVGLGPLPGASVMGPVEMETFDRLITNHAWPSLRRHTWPLDLEGDPIVETRRKDQLVHTVKSWQSLSDLRRMYRRNTPQLEALNPDLDLRSLEEGDEVVVWCRDQIDVPESRGNPQAGRLIDGEPMPDSDNYVVQFRHRSFGTYYAVSETVRMLDEYYERFPDADPLVVGDLSHRTGRSIHPHSSHQAGRDVDITLPRHEPPPDYRRFHHVSRDNLDAEKTLWLLLTLLEGGYVEYIFLDWNHQRTLYRLAEQQGAPDDWLEEVFQYPSRDRQGLIRHEPGHATHFHVRFACQPTDQYCGSGH